MTGKTVLVLGCGIGGLAASNSLKRLVGKQARVTLIERKTNFQFPPSYRARVLILGFQPKGDLRARGPETVVVKRKGSEREAATSI